MNKARIAKAAGWLSAAVALLAANGLFGKYSALVGSLVPTLTAIAVHHAADTSADNPSGKPTIIRGVAVFFAFLTLGVVSAHAQATSMRAPDGYPVLRIAADPAPSPTPALPTNLYAAGLAYNPGASPAIAGNAMYAHLLSADMGTYGFTLVDVFLDSVKPFTASTNIGGGIAQKVFSIGKVPIFIPTSVAITSAGTHTGWNWSTGGEAVIKASTNWWILPNIRTQKSSVSNGAGYQVIFGVSLGWGK